MSETTKGEFAVRIKSDALQQLVDEIADASKGGVLVGGSAMLTIIAEAIMDRLNLPYKGKPKVNFDIEVDERTRIILTWPEEEADADY